MAGITLFGFKSQLTDLRFFAGENPSKVVMKFFPVLCYDAQMKGFLEQTPSFDTQLANNGQVCFQYLSIRVKSEISDRSKVIEIEYLARDSSSFPAPAGAPRSAFPARSGAHCSS